VCKINKDVAVFIGADQDDNECILSNVLEILEECLENITKNNLTKGNVMENYQQLALMIDEMVDEGIIINTDSESIENRVFMREVKTFSDSNPASGGGYFKSVILIFIFIIFSLVIFFCKEYSF